MAIDDNASYELTGYQVKDLAQKIRAKADSNSLASVATSGLYSDLTGAPTIPTVYNGTLTIQQNGTTLGTFSANQSSNETINITGGGGGGTAFYLNNSLTTLPSGYVAPTLYKDQALTTTATFQELWDAYKSGGAVLYFANSWKAEIYTIAYAWDDLNEGHDYHFALYTYNHGNNQSTQSGAIANSVIYHLDGGASDTTSYTLVGEYFTVIPPEPKVFWTNVDADLFDDTTTVYFYKDSQLQTTAMLSDIAWHAGVVDTYIFVKHNNIPAKKFKVIYSNPYYDSDNKYSFEVVGDLDPSSSTQPLIAKFRGAGSATSATPIVAKLAPMAGATSSVAGTSGLVPQPAAGDQDKVLRGDGTWDNTIKTVYASLGGSYSGNPGRVDMLGFTGFYRDAAMTDIITGYELVDMTRKNVVTVTYHDSVGDNLSGILTYVTDGDEGVITCHIKTYTGANVSCLIASVTGIPVVENPSAQYEMHYQPMLKPGDNITITEEHVTDGGPINKSFYNYVISASAVTVYYISNYLYNFSGTFTIYSDAACTTAVSKSDFDTSIKNGMVRLVYSPGGLHSTWTVFEYYDDLVDYDDPADEPDYVVFGRGSSYGTDYAFWRFSWVGANPALNAASYVPIRNMTGASSSVAGSAGIVPAPAAGDQEKVLHGDGTWKDATAKLVEMSYGEANAWAKFIAAYNAGSIVYCRASSNANPASGSQTRKAFMAYVNNAATPTEVEFQYVRSVSSKTSSQPVDQVFVYKLTNANGGTWSVQTRDMAPKIAAGTGINVSYSNGTYTISLA